jgi:hypothetical protein
MQHSKDGSGTLPGVIVFEIPLLPFVVVVLHVFGDLCFQLLEGQAARLSTSMPTHWISANFCFSA